MAMAYGNVYVANVAFGAKDAQTVKAFAEAEAYPGPSIIIAFSHCIAHGYDLALGIEQQKLAVETGLLAAVPVRPVGRPAEHAAPGPRLGRAEGRGREVHAERDAVPPGRTAGSGPLRHGCSRKPSRT